MKTGSFHCDGMVIDELSFSVPLSYQRHPLESCGALVADHHGNIVIRAREVRLSADRDHKPILVFFQGGPGFPPADPVAQTGWLKRALVDFRVLLLEQRGTGRSSPVSVSGLLRLQDAGIQVQYLSHFRADSIVADAEHIRRSFYKGEKWSVLGQSFGGFCVLHYLSQYPEALTEALITGGLPSLDAHPDEIYRLTCQSTLAHNRTYFNRFPDDRDIAARLAERLAREPLLLPDGSILTPRLLQCLGIRLGSWKGMESIHYALSHAFDHHGTLNPLFAHRFLGIYNLVAAPIYYFLHEAIYAQGVATRWSADRMVQDFPAISCSGVEDFCFVGEMMFPFLSEDIAAFRPLKELADGLARKEDWPSLYDPSRLAKNQVPCAAVIYYDDMYVPRQLSEDTIRRVPGIRAWFTNEYCHSGINYDGCRILDRLLAMLRD